MLDLLATAVGFLLFALLAVGLVLAVLTAVGVIAVGSLAERLADLLIPGRKTGLGATGIVEQLGVVVRPVYPEAQGAPAEGTVQVAGELWKARAGRGGQPIPAGRRVLIEAADGMTLIVSEAKSNRIS